MTTKQAPAPRLAIPFAHRKRVRVLAFSPDGQFLASGSDDRTIRLWDTGTGDRYDGTNGECWGVSDLAFAPDGMSIAFVCRGVKEPVKDHTKAFLWNLRRHQVQELSSRNGHQSPFRSPCFSPSGQIIAFRHDVIRLYDVRSGNHVGDVPEGRKGDALTFSPDGSKLVFGYWEGTLHIWDASEREEVRTLKGHTDYITSLAFSPDGRLLGSASSSHGKPWPARREDRSIRLWDFEAGKKLRRFTGDWDTTICLAFLPDSRKFISFHDPDSRPTVRLWSSADDEPLAAWAPGTDVRSVALSRDGRWIATGNRSGTIRLWELPAILPS